MDAERRDRRRFYTEDGTSYHEKHVGNRSFSDPFDRARLVAAQPNYQITDFADLH
jgi:hypothetical protein